MILGDFPCLSCKHFGADNNNGCKAFPDDMQNPISKVFDSNFGLIPIDLIEKVGHDKVIKGQIGNYIYTYDSKIDNFYQGRAVE